MIKMALHVPSGIFRHVDQAENGGACQCQCPQCGENLIAVHPKEYQSHYRHESNVDCKGAQETAIHKLAKQIIAESNMLFVNVNRQLFYSDVVLEPWIKPYRSDARFISDGAEYFCEVVVKHQLSPVKEQFYQSTNRKCLEIDLTEFIGKEYSYEEIKEALLTKVSNKRMIQLAIDHKAKDEFAFLKFALFLLLVFFGIRTSFTRF
jgi:hypothetical protein